MLYLDLSLIGWSILKLCTFNLSGIFFSDIYKEAIHAEVYMILRNKVNLDNNGYMKAKRSGKTYISTRINGRKRAFRVKVSGYTITYKNVGINSSKNRERLSGKRAVTLRSPRKKGYTFVGWYDSSGKNVTVIPKGNTKNLILHAKWDKTSSKDSVKAK